MPENNQTDSITPFAITNFRDIKKRFGIKEQNRQGHLYLVGKTGTGKSTLLENMIVSDLREGKGLALIDPHGDLAEAVLDFVPKRRMTDVIYFNPADLDYPVAFNPLGKVHPDFRHLVVSGLISAFKKVWLDFWGPRLEHILRYSLFTLLEYPGSTLLDLPRLLTDKGFRETVVQSLTNQPVREFWLLEFEKYSVWLRSEAISPILNKTGQFLASTPMRNIIGQRENRFSIRKAMDEGKVLIANLAKGRIGEDNSALLGTMLLTKIQLAALSRANVDERKRRFFYLYVDEIQNFLTLAFADILSEARKYGLSLILAHQYLEQLDERIRAAILGNVGTIITFRLGAEDAKYLASEFQPDFSAEDLMRLANYHIYLKLMINGVTSRPFSAITLSPPERKTSHKREIIELSRTQHGRPRKEVEKEILAGSPLALVENNQPQLRW